MTPSNKCYALIKEFEGCQLKAYKCPAGIWTIGYGNTQYEDGRPVREGDTITQERAEKLLKIIVEKFAISVEKFLKRYVKQHEFDALVSLCYNIGIGNFEGSTLLRLVNKLAPADEVMAQFMRWNKAKGKVLAGLSRRRAAEAALYKNG